MLNLINRNYMVGMVSVVPANNKQKNGLTLLYPSSCK